MINDIKAILNITNNNKDNLLFILIKQETDFARECTKEKNIPDFIVCQMVVYRYNRLGTEALNSESYAGGVDYSYADYPSNVQKYLNKPKKMRCV